MGHVKFHHLEKVTLIFFKFNSQTLSLKLQNPQEGFRTLSKPLGPFLFQTTLENTDRHTSSLLSQSSCRSQKYMILSNILKLWQEHRTLCRSMARLLTVSIICTQFREDNTYSFAYLSAWCIIPIFFLLMSLLLVI